MEIKTTKRTYLKTFWPKKIDEKGYLLKKTHRKISNIDILNGIISRLKGNFELSFDGNKLVLSHENKNFKVVV